MDRDISLGYLSPLGKSSASLGMIGWEALGDQWHGMGRRARQMTEIIGLLKKIKTVYYQYVWLGYKIYCIEKQMKPYPKNIWYNVRKVKVHRTN